MSKWWEEECRIFVETMMATTDKIVAIEDWESRRSHESLEEQLRKYGNTVVELRQPPPPYVTVAKCGHCFEDVGENQ